MGFIKSADLTSYVPAGPAFELTEQDRTTLNLFIVTLPASDNFCADPTMQYICTKNIFLGDVQINGDLTFAGPDGTTTAGLDAKVGTYGYIKSTTSSLSYYYNKSASDDRYYDKATADDRYQEKALHVVKDQSWLSLSAPAGHFGFEVENMSAGIITKCFVKTDDVTEDAFQIRSPPDRLFDCKFAMKVPKLEITDTANSNVYSKTDCDGKFALIGAIGGLTSVLTDNTTIEGTGITGSPIKLKPGVAMTDDQKNALDCFTYNNAGDKVLSVSDAYVFKIGDNPVLASVVTDSTLTGNGTTASPLHCTVQGSSGGIASVLTDGTTIEGTGIAGSPIKLKSSVLSSYATTASMNTALGNYTLTSGLDTQVGTYGYIKTAALADYCLASSLNGFNLTIQGIQNSFADYTVTANLDSLITSYGYAKSTGTEGITSVLTDGTTIAGTGITGRVTGFTG
jgi:hypothetical protein